MVMSGEKRLIEQNLETELRFLERQALLKTLWKLSNQTSHGTEVETQEKLRSPIGTRREPSYSISD
jgi:hypothetical protein